MGEFIQCFIKIMDIFYSNYLNIHIVPGTDSIEKVKNFKILSVSCFPDIIFMCASMQICVRVQEQVVIWQ